MTSARCRTEGTDVFFHERYKHAVKVAKALCGDCPVVTDCLRFAIVNEEVGVWGGMTTTERRLYARRHGAPQPGERITGGAGGGEMAE
jgi:WhiB family redox-sensing transcriptional regulator